MKINQKIFSIPPYISTCWSNVRALHMDGAALIVTLNDGKTIQIPGLSTPIVEGIFTTHANFLEQLNSSENSMQSGITSVMNPFTDIFPQDPQSDSHFRLTIGSLDELGSVMHHNSQQSNAPDIPKEILEKIVSITKIVAPEDLTLPKAEPHCNCTHCQIARALDPQEEPQPVLQNVLPHKEKEEEIVSETELSFQQWDITQTGNQLFTVANRLDPQEKYNVFLGNPVGCTCGKSGCEHIIAVLKS